MPRFIISFNAGYGEDHEIIEAESQDTAEQSAYEAWRQAAENNADYGAEPYSRERAIELGLEDDDE